MEKFGEIGNPVAIGVIRATRIVARQTKRVAEIRQPPPVWNAIRVAGHIGNFADLNSRNPRIVGDWREENLQMRVGDGVGENAAQRNVLPGGGGEDVEVGQHVLALDEHVENPLAGGRPISFRFEQRGFVDAGGTIKFIKKTAARGAEMFALIKRLRARTNAADVVRHITADTAGITERAESIVSILEPDAGAAIGDVRGIAAADALLIIPRHVEETDADGVRAGKIARNVRRARGDLVRPVEKI